MRGKLAAVERVLGVGLAGVFLGLVSAHGQTRGDTGTLATPYVAPRNVHGQPDLQGTWNFGTLTPLERPDRLAGRTHLTDDEIEAIERKSSADAERRDERGLTPDTMDQSKYSFDRRTSLIVDPPDGKMPPLTALGRERSIAHIRRMVSAPRSPEDRTIWDRCILGWNSGPPMIPTVPLGYNQNVQIFQTRDHLVILNEQIHNARIVPIDGRPHGGIRQWAGDSRGRWEGDTLVVETTNFTPLGTGTITLRQSLRVVFDEHLRLTERFTRVRDDTIAYEFVIDDATIWTRPWTVRVPLSRTDGKMYEYACHEGNYAMFNMLSAARAEEAKGESGHCYSFDFDCEDAKKFDQEAGTTNQPAR
jgi:hypothetical protein